MRIVEIKPKNRDKKAKYMYKLLDWIFRKNRKLIESEIQQRVDNYILHGEVDNETA